MAVCNTCGLKSSSYIRRKLNRQHKKPIPRKPQEFPIIDYYEKRVREEKGY